MISVKTLRNDLLLMMDSQQQSLEFLLIFLLSILLLILFLNHVTAVQSIASMIKMSVKKGSYDVDSELAKLKNGAKKKKKAVKTGASNYGFSSKIPLDADDEELEMFSV